MTDFEKQLQNLINCHSKENGSDTPDFILAEYLNGCLENFNRTVKTREVWYGRGINAKVATPAGMPIEIPYPPVTTFTQPATDVPKIS
jgi:hypothetical protein